MLILRYKKRIKVPPLEVPPRPKVISEELQQWLNRQRPANEEKLADYQNRFRTAPLGCWSAAVGTFNAVMDEAWEFRPDGTGIYEGYGCWGSPKNKMLFEWKPLADWNILCHVTNWKDDADQDGEDVNDEDDESESDNSETKHWGSVNYGFRIVETDCGTEIAMCSVSDGIMQDGFWIGQFALGYSGSIDDAEQSAS